jgi:probable rRNA maturation factor
MVSKAYENDTTSNVELIFESEYWESEIADISSLCVAICNNVIKRHEIVQPTVVILLSDNKAIQELNLKWRGFDKPTNVLSFPNIDSGFVIGDIAIAFEYSFDEATKQNKSFPSHFTHLLVHGLLHLLGYDHETQSAAEEMESLEAEILRDFGISDPYIIEDNFNEES